MNIKQFIFIRKDLNMRKGKAIAQSIHASTKPLFGENCDLKRAKLDIAISKEELIWKQNNFPIEIVEVKDEEELLSIYNTAIRNNISSILIQDHGLTEFKGVYTYTAVSIGPYEEEEIKKIINKEMI